MFFKENYESFIRYHLDKHGFRLSDCPELEQVLSTSDFFQKACDSIRSPFMIKEHCKTKMNMTEPISYTVRDHSVSNPTGIKQILSGGGCVGTNCSG